jgi:hypothetical protein
MNPTYSPRERGTAMKSLLARLFTTRPARPVFAEDANPERAMRIAELKWLLEEIAEPRGGAAW